MTKIEELKRAVEQFDALPFDEKGSSALYIRGEAVRMLPALLEAADLLAYALQVFKDTCDCGECAPCLGAQEMEAVLEKLK